MDTLFRLVTFHHPRHPQQQQQQQPQQQHHPADQHSFTTTSSTTSSKYQHHPYHYLRHHHLEDEEEECCIINHNDNSNNSNSYNAAAVANNAPDYMDEDDFSSSSSSKHNHHHHHHHHLFPYTSTTTTTATSSSATTTPPHHSSSFDNPSTSAFPSTTVDLSSPCWSHDLLLECARAVSSRDSPRVQHLLWTLNELSSPYGDTDQKLSSHFLQALFARMTSTGDRCLRTLSSASDLSSSFESTRRVSLRFQEASPWSPFGHVASNSSLLDALDGETRLHLLDLGTTFCTQWPTLLESLATRPSPDDSPYLHLTTVLPSASPSAQRVMKEVGSRMERFARLMGVPFAFRYVHHEGDLSTLDLSSLCEPHPDEVLAVNCVNALHSLPSSRARDALLASIRRLNPRVVTLVEESADMTPASSDVVPDDDGDFLKVFGESLRLFSAYLDSLEESFPRTSNERLALERAAGRAVVDLVACDPARSTERRETGRRWSARMRKAGFEPVGLSDDGADDVRALLRRYKEGWSLLHGADVDESTAGIYLAWKEQPVVWASAWKPST